MTKQNTPVRAVVDTNLIVSGLLKKPGVPYQIVEALRHGHFTLVLSPLLLTEYRQVLQRPKLREKYTLTEEEITAFLFLIETHAHIVTPQHRLPVNIRDKRDEGVLATALGGQADYLVSGDQDLLVLKDEPGLRGLRIVTAKEFLNLLKVQETLA
jgi:putative PIN family toxin of toxin-antitoxin system